MYAVAVTVPYPSTGVYPPPRVYPNFTGAVGAAWTGTWAVQLR